MSGRCIAGLLCLLNAASLLAADNGWRLVLGTSYRRFGEVEHDFTFRNYDRARVPGGPFGVQNWSRLPTLADGSGVTADVVRSAGDGADTVSGWSPLLGADVDLYRRDPFCLSATAALQWYRIATDAAGGSGGVQATHSNYTVVDGLVLAPPLNDAPLPGLSAGTRVDVAAAEFEADLYALDAGLRASAHRGRFSLTCAAGPTLHLCDAESRTTEAASWNSVAVPGTRESYRMTHRETAVDAVFGLYASAGVGVALTETLGVTVEARYDHVSDTLGTAQARLGLDGFSGVLRVTVGF